MHPFFLLLTFSSAYWLVFFSPSKFWCPKAKPSYGSDHKPCPCSDLLQIFKAIKLGKVCPASHTHVQFLQCLISVGFLRVLNNKRQTNFNWNCDTANHDTWVICTEFNKTYLWVYPKWCAMDLSVTPLLHSLLSCDSPPDSISFQRDKPHSNLAGFLQDLISPIMGLCFTPKLVSRQCDWIGFQL